MAKSKAQRQEPEVESQEEEEIVTHGAAQAHVQNASLLNALEGKFSAMAGMRSGYVASLPADVRSRLDALKNLAKKTNSIDREFQREINELEKKYYVKHQPIFELRKAIVLGEREPTAEECERTAEDLEDEEELPPAPTDTEPVKGVPEFWLTCLKNLPPLQETITEEDEGALKHLVDLRYRFLAENPGFVLEFVFEENPYFSAEVLTKSYYLLDHDGNRDLVYDHAEGCEIDWKEGKNLSVRVEVKKQRHKATNKTRTVKKTVPAETFFSFFSPPQIPEDQDEEDVDDDMMQALEIDYETGEMIKEKLIPDAVNWFTGKALEEFEEDYSEEEGEDDYYGEDDDEEEDDEDVVGATGAAPAPECKQQ